MSAVGLQRPDYDAVIIGAGHNGLVSAWYLAEAGLKVLVLERRHLVGGACVTEELWPGFSAPTCSYICYILQAKVIDDMDLREYGFAVHHTNPHQLTPFPDGRRVLLWDDAERSMAEIAKFSEQDARRYPEYMALRTRMATIVNHFMLRPAPSLAELVEYAREIGEEALLERMLFGSVSNLIEEHFESAEIRGMFTSAWDCGNPDAPGSIMSSIYPRVEAFTPEENYGVVSGGMGTITQAMARSCQTKGVEIRTEAEVKRVLVENGRAVGVELVNGESITSRIVLSNADPKTTFLKLVDQDALPSEFTGAVSRLSTKAAYFKFHAALKELPDFWTRYGADIPETALADIVICPSMDYYRQSWDDAIHGRISSCPVMNVQIPTVYDRTLVPNGGHVMSIWVQYAPAKPANGTWDDLRDQAAEMLIDELAKYAPNIREVMIDYLLYTPLDIERRVGMTDGQIRHIDMINGQLFANRPLPGWADYRTPVEGLYLCGAGTHPGGEVTGAPGHNAAQAVLKALSLTPR
jgi:phytoene dehydrogenase-like protein